MLTAKKSIAKKSAVKSVRKPTHFYLRVLSRHPSVSELRNKVLIPKHIVVYRHGSSTAGKFEYEINSVECVKNSSDKLLMKRCFDQAEICHAPWFHVSEIDGKKKEWQEFLKKLDFGKDAKSFLIAKQRWGSRGVGNYLIKTQQDLDKFLSNHKKNLNNYIIEEYKNYSIEYRIHATEHGYFYACKKVLKKDTPKEERFQRHDDNCAWLVEDNKDFNKPSNWNEIVEHCKKAVTAMHADVLAFDVKCTDPANDKEGKRKVRFIIIESCSAPSFGKVTTQKYLEELPKIAKRKYDL
jgi:D-alanine-D-alanine ligase-like ATP-grasp enzyme